MSFVLSVEYPAELYFSNPDMDENIIDAAQAESDGSGMGCGLRDISFTFETEAEARDTAGRITTYVHRSVTVNLYELEDDYV